LKAVESYVKYKDENSYAPERPRGLSFLIKPFLFILLIWIIFWADVRFMLNLFHFGILPRHIEGLPGIIASPLIHGSLRHLSNNSIPILVLGAGLYYFYPRIANVVVLASWLISGMVVWIIGRENFHIGASGLIYSLAAFIFLSGILRKQPNLLALSLLVVFLYGGLVWGVFPLQESVSWEAHLAGGVSGLALAIRYRSIGPARKTYSWDEDEVITEEDEQHQTEKDPEPWQTYSESRHGIHYVYHQKKEAEDE